MPRLFNIAHLQKSKRDSLVVHINVRLRAKVQVELASSFAAGNLSISS